MGLRIPSFGWFVGWLVVKISLLKLQLSLVLGGKMRGSLVTSIVLTGFLVGCGGVSGAVRNLTQLVPDPNPFDFKISAPQALYASSSANCETGAPRFKAWLTAFPLDVSDPDNFVTGELRFFFYEGQSLVAVYREFTGETQSFSEAVTGTFTFENGELTVPGFGAGRIDVLGDNVVFQFSLTSTRHTSVGTGVDTVLRAQLATNPLSAATCP